MFSALSSVGPMRKVVIAKGNMRRNDVMRAIVTDTLPEEVPIVFSNDGFYKNLISPLDTSSPEQEFFDCILIESRPYTIPYRFRVLRDQSTTRGLSLLHPAAEVAVAQFYARYHSLICYYASQSEFSLRHPVKTGSTYFIKSFVSRQNRVRHQSIDTVSLENSVSNPASYFSYNKFSRAHQFFDSIDYLHLEKKFDTFKMLDIAKCFNSIYTHSISWAVSDIKTSKDNTSASTFGNDFDRLMQSANYNETNGICIGPEVSRIFAEIILSRADNAIVSSLKASGYELKTDYDVRRYVDDYYIFARSPHVADCVTAAVQVELGSFNLHLNHEKSVLMHRPFSTQKSEVIASTNNVLTSFFGKFIEYRIADDDRIAEPLTIRKSDALLKGLIANVKAECVRHSTNYQTISDYIVSALSKRVIELSEGAEGRSIAESKQDSYVSAFMALLEASYFFYTVNPTVRASLNLARSIVTAAQFLRTRLPDRLPFLSETVVRWTIDLAKSMNNGSRHRELTAIPIEVLNIVIPMKELADNEPLVDSLINSLCEQVEKFEYFEVVSFLFLLSDTRRHRGLVQKLFARAKKILSDGHGPFLDSQSAHLVLDLLSCPHLDAGKRGSWFNSMRAKAGLPRISRQSAVDAVVRMQSRPWFVRWEGLDLLQVLKKKELSPVY